MNCGNATTPVTLNAETNWDTTLAYQGMPMLTPEFLARTLVSEGTDGRLAIFIDKCRRGGDVRVGFIGGSVTKGANATVTSLRYSSLLCRFLQRLFPKARFKEINAGVSGTDSRFAVSRVKDDLLIQKPDLILVEFAVNDDPYDSVLYPPSFEGLIRQCLSSTESALLVYFTMNNAQSLVSERFKVPIGLHYGLPMVSLMRGVFPWIGDSVIAIDTLVDIVHPTNRGHFLGAYSLFGFIKAEALKEQVKLSTVLPSPLYGNIYDTAGIFHLGDSSLQVQNQTGWVRMEREIGRIGWVAANAGSGLEIRFSGKELTLGYHVSKFGNSLVEITVDGKVLDTLSDYFAGDWGGGVMRLRQLHLSPNPKTVDISLKVLEGTNFTVDYLLHGGAKPIP